MQDPLNRPTILALDCATEGCAVALVRGDTVLAVSSVDAERGQAEKLLVMVEDALRDASLPAAAIDRIAVTTGPGSFTGIRIGLAAARGLALALDRPVIGIDTFDAVAYGIPEALRRDRSLLIAGTGAALVAALRPDLDLLAAHRRPDPVAMARLAATRPLPEAPPRPFYLRPPDAKAPRARITLQPLTLAFAATASALHEAAFADAWSPENFATMLADPTNFGWLAVEGASPVGLVLARTAGDEAEIIAIGTLPAARRRGVGQQLLAAALDEAIRRGAAAAFLEVAAGNEAARALYSRLGFVQVGNRPHYYADGQDALILKKALASP